MMKRILPALFAFLVGLALASLCAPAPEPDCVRAFVSTDRWPIGCEFNCVGAEFFTDSAVTVTHVRRYERTGGVTDTPLCSPVQLKAGQTHYLFWQITEPEAAVIWHEAPQ